MCLPMSGNVETVAIYVNIYSYNFKNQNNACLRAMFLLAGKHSMQLREQEGEPPVYKM